MSGQHTQGPWRVHDDGTSPMHRYVVAAFGETVAYLYCTKGDEAEDAANARLIGAAPALLEALERLADLASSFSVSGVYFDEPCFPDHQKALQAANAAIALAKGEG